MKKSTVIIILAVVGLALLISTCAKEDPNDGKCDICGKPSTYGDGTEEYCEKHLRDAVEWYIKQGSN